tara:strand:- start:399 stop:1544 length:1146 start_codon:yes stop_codon:yes gene_type:complete
MPVPSSGPLGLYKDIWGELAGSQGENSLHSASVYAGFSTPDAMSDFYGFVDADPPSVTTNASSGATVSSIVSNGNVTADGGSGITERGFYVGTDATYTNNTKTSVAGTTGTFNLTTSGLTAGTTYYSTAYAINLKAESVGSTVSIATAPASYASVDYLVLAGGGTTVQDPGFNSQGGGGGGGYRTTYSGGSGLSGRGSSLRSRVTITNGATYSVTVGGAATSSRLSGTGVNISTVGGGSGRCGYGGCGGGGGNAVRSASCNGAGTTDEGYNGGNDPGYYNGGGGGGVGSAGGLGGGAGYNNSITASTTKYGYGAPGKNHSVGGPAYPPGGGPNTGYGGQASGIVVVRIPATVTPAQISGGTTSYSGGSTILKFTSSGTFRL